MDYTKLKKSELIRLLEVREREVAGTPDGIVKALEPYSLKEQEQLIVVLLDAASKIIKTEVVSVGLVNRTIVHPREVFCPAIRNRATAIAIAHNHPSGELNPSREDYKVTEVLIEAGKLLGIKLVDHIVFGYGKYYSMAEKDSYMFAYSERE